MSQARVPSTVASAGAVARIALPAQDEDIATLRRAVVAKLTYAVGKDPIVASDRDWFVAVALTVRDRIVERWFPSTRAIYAQGRKRVYYLSLEFLIGRLLLDSLNNLGLTDPMRAALAELGVDLDRLRQIEPDAALGNGGLGRLAACFMESMATLSIAAYGYGIRYNHGLFRQVIKDGWQHEFPENWLSFGNPWEFERPEVSYAIGFGGTVEAITGADGSTRHVWHPAETVDALAYDTADRRLARPARQHAAPVVGARARPAEAGCVQPRRPCRRAGVARARQRDLAGPLSERRDRRRGRSCGCGRSISSPPPRCRTCCAATCASTRTSARCPTRRRSSSTTRIPRSRSPS